MDTHLAFLDDSYTKEFDAKIVLVKDERFIVLDKTYFYATSGGQPNDTGILKIDIPPVSFEYKVVNVMKKDGILYHEVDKPGLKDGMKIHGILDWERRYKLMRSHTAAHLLCYIFHNKAGAMITGNQLNVDECRIDFSLKDFDKEKISHYFNLANELVKKDYPVSVNYMSLSEAEKDPSMFKLAKGLPPTLTHLRIVSIGDIDKQADGGTHVKSTSEVLGMTLIDMKNKGAENRRLYFRLD